MGLGFGSRVQGGDGFLLAGLPADLHLKLAIATVA
jgi:hypothetical protein